MPTIASVHPLRAVEGGRITILGSDFPVDELSTVLIGDVEARIALRVTDRQNGPGGGDSATTQELPVSVTARCVPDLGIGGSTCLARTSVNALIPGAVIERKRAIWELGAVDVFDGGEDGDVTTPDNGLLATQGLFIP